MAHKLKKINELIKHELAQIILREEEFGPGVLVTILDVNTTEDQKEAAIIFSVWPDNQKETVSKKLNARIWHLQQIINKRLKIHPVPKLRFKLNTDEATSQQIEELIRKTKNGS